jgi:hypothetical protein
MRISWCLSHLLTFLGTARSTEPGTSRNLASQKLVFPSGLQIEICPGACGGHMEALQEDILRYWDAEHDQVDRPSYSTPEADGGYSRQFGDVKRAVVRLYRDHIYEQEAKDDSLVVNIHQDSDCTGDIVAQLL